MLQIDWFIMPTVSLRVVLVGVVTVVLVIGLLKLLLKNRRLPPGPWGAPVVGYLPFMVRSGESMPTRLAALTKMYVSKGVISLKLGSQLVVCLSDPRVVRDTFKRVEFTGRPRTPLSDVAGRLGVITSDGEVWRRQRQFLLEKLRALGVTHTGGGKHFMEQLIMREVEELMEVLASREHDPVDPDELLGRHVHNVVLQLICSQRFQAGDPSFTKYYRMVAEGMRLYGQVHIGEYLPIYLRLPGKREVLNKLKAHHRDICEYQLDMVRDRMAHASTEQPNDLLDHYLLEIAKAKEEGIKSHIFAGVEEDAQVVQVMNDLFSAGMETVKTSLLWSLALLARPEGQRVGVSVRAELASVVEVGGRVTMEHADRLIYCQATLLEVLRYCSVVPLGTVHSATRDCEIEGYEIPEGSQVIALISALHMDPSAWRDPHLFQPERFINDKGQLTRNEHFMPFGVGRRMCLGDILAKTELFLFFSNILNCFKFSLPKGSELPPLQGVMGATHSPHPYLLQFEKRKSVNKIRNVASY